MSSDADKSEVKVFKFGEESLSDVIFIVDGNEFHCHKMALAARSPYFASMFTSSFKEKNEERIEIEADPIAFRRLMEILYVGIFENHEIFFQEGESSGESASIIALWSESCALFELADRFLVLDIVRNTFEVYMIAADRDCDSAYCYLCATKLLISLRYQITRYKDICQVKRSTIATVVGDLESVEKELTFPTDAVKFLLKL